MFFGRKNKKPAAAKKPPRASYRPAGARPRFGRRLLRFCLRVVALAGLGAVLALLGWLGLQFHGFLYESDYFRVREVRIGGVRARVEHELRQALAREGYDSAQLLSLDAAALRRLVEANPRVRRASVHKAYPRSLEIEAEEREILAFLVHDPLLGIDRDGVVVEAVSLRHPLALRHPFLSGIGAGALEPGDRLQSENLTMMLELLLSLQSRSPSLYRQLSELHLAESGELTMLLQGGTEIRFGRGDPFARMPKLETFLSALGPPVRYAYIDLRFDGQVPAMTKEEARKQASTTNSDSSRPVAP